MPTIAWISYFPIEWLPDLPEPLRNLPRLHPATWQRVLLDELKTVPGLDLHVLIVRKQFPKNYIYCSQNVTFHCLKVPAGMRMLSLFWWETLLIRRRLRQIRPNLVHAWGSERAAALVASRLPCPYLVTMQGLLQWYLERVDLGKITRVEARLENVALRRARVITTESSFAVRWLKEHYSHLEVCQAEHAPNWVFHKVLRRPETRPMRFLFVGPIAPIKGTDLLLRALDALRSELDFRLTIVGGGAPDFIHSIRTATSPDLWERVEIKHGLSPAQVADELSRAAMVLFPTRVDTSPNSVKEAVVAGVPVVASAIGGIVDYVLPDRNGFTFPAGDLPAFIATLKQAVAHPLFSRGEVDPSTLARMRDYLSPRVMAERFLDAYRRAENAFATPASSSISR